MSLNGVQIEIGQVWRNRDGDLCTVIGRTSHPGYPWAIDNGRSVDDCGSLVEGHAEPEDLMELITTVLHAEDDHEALTFHELPPAVEQSSVCLGRAGDNFQEIPPMRSIPETAWVDIGGAMMGKAWGVHHLSNDQFDEQEVMTATAQYSDILADVLADGLKPTNPKDIIGSNKLPLHLWPTTATAMGCIGMLEGATKYGRSNFRAIGIRASIYIDACKRHLDAWMEGEENAPDSGVPHLANALSCLAIIVDAQAAGKLNDDRMVAGGYRDLVERLTPHVARLKELHKDKNPKHYTIKDKVESNG